MNTYFFNKAEMSKPKLFKEKLEPITGSVLEVSPKSHFGIVTKDVPIHKNPLKFLDSVIIDFGRHVHGSFSFSIAGYPEGCGFPANLIFIFAESPHQLTGKWNPFLQAPILIESNGTHTLPWDYSFRYVKIMVYYTPTPLYIDDFCSEAITSSDSSAFIPLPEGTDQSLVDMDIVGARTLQDSSDTIFNGKRGFFRYMSPAFLYIGGLTDAYLFGNASLTRRSFYLFAALEQTDHFLPNTFAAADENPYLYAKENIVDALLYPIALCDYYIHYNDRVTLNDILPVALRQLTHAISFLDDNGVLRLPKEIETTFDCKPILKTATAVQGLLLYAVRRIVGLARILEDRKMMSEWNTIHYRLKIMTRKEFYNKRKKAFINRHDDKQYDLLSQSLMILADVVSRADGIRILKKCLKSKRCQRPKSPFTSHFVVEALLHVGMKDEALAYIKDYWGEMVKRGADTYWELFDKNDPLLCKGQDRRNGSFCSPTACSVSYFIRKYFV